MFCRTDSEAPKEEETVSQAGKGFHDEALIDNKVLYL
jgi:hypothetical protein